MSPIKTSLSCFYPVLKTILSVLAVFQLAACGGGGGSASSSGEPQEEVRAFSVSGSIAVERFADADQDVEERFNISFVDNNNSFAEAQYLANPVSLGGYVSGTNGGFLDDPDGSCDLNPFVDCVPYRKDLSDFFELRLSENQKVSLSVFAAAEFGTSVSDLIDLDFVLYRRVDSDTRTEEARLNFSSEQTRTLTVPETGDYYLSIETAVNVSAPVLYTLTVSQSLQSSAVRTMHNTSMDFVPGEVLVRFRDTSSQRGVAANGGLAGARFLSPRSSMSAQGLRAEKSLGASTMLYRASDQALEEALRFEQAGVASALTARQQRQWQTLKLVEMLREQTDVLYAEPNYLYSALAVTPNDPLYGQQWNLPMIELPAAWDFTSGAGVRVAVIDSGVDADHVDLNDNIVSADGYDFVRDMDMAGDGDGPDNDPAEEGSSYHGAHVAGTVAAEGFNGRGVVGVAYGASIVPLRALGVEGLGTVADIADAIYYAAGLNNSTGQTLSEAVDIINLSLGAPSDSFVFEDAINAALGQGVIVIAAAGNESTSLPSYPAAYPGVVAVSSVNSDRTLSSFSNFGSHIDVAAPGGFNGFRSGILSTVYASQYSELVGTSMAAPHVAGVAALMKAIYNDLDSTEFQTILESGDITDNLGAPGFYGAGLINAAKAVTKAAELASSGQTLPPSLNAFPSQFGFFGGDTASVLSLSNPGSGTVTVSSVNSPADWIEVTQLSVNPDGLGQYTVQLDTLALPVQPTLTTEIVVRYQIDGGAEQQQRLDVFVSRVEQEGETVGALYVYLLREADVVDAEESGGTIEIYTSVNGSLEDGEYSFEFVNVPPGRYYLEASTDNDGDYFVFDQGEARGAYPLLFENSFIDVVDANITDLSFDVRYQNFAESSASATDTTPNIAPRVLPRHASTGASEPAIERKLVRP